MKRVIVLMLGVALALSFALALSSCSVLLGGGNNDEVFYCPEGTHEYEWVVIDEATCFSTGRKEYVCKNCPITNGIEMIPMLEHDMITVFTKPSTCTEAGYKDVACKNCSTADRRETIPKTEHDLVAVNGKAPTCEEDGFSDYQRCKWCTYNTREVIKATGHTLGAWVENTPVGCTYAGTEKAECTGIGCDYYEVRDVLALGHDEVPHIGKDATCTEDGWTEYVSCTRCDYNTKVVIPAGHKFVNGVCSACGTTKYLKFTLSDDETYYTVTGIGDYTDENEIVVIPELYCGLPVKKIGSRAFAGCKNIVSITVPDSVEYIDYGAFNGCSALAELTVPFVGASDDAVGYRIHLGYVFGCATYYAPINNYHYRSRDPYMDGEAVEGLPLEDGYYYFRYYIPSSLKRVTVTDTEAIDAFALRNCGFIESIIIDDTVTSVGAEAFFGCTALTSVYYMGTEESWSGISVGSDNAPLTDAARYYYSEQDPGKEGDFWYYGDDGEIVIWPEHIHNLVFGETVTEEGCYTNGEALWECESDKCDYTEPKVIPAAHNYDEYDVCVRCGDLKPSDGIEYTLGWGGDFYKVSGIGSCTDTEIVLANVYNGLPVKEIATNAFRNNSNIVALVMQSNLETISACAFLGCTGLKNIVIPNNVTRIEDSSFSCCSSLESITMPIADRPMGCLFGENKYEGSYSIVQYTNNGLNSQTYYVPLNLKKITITGNSISDYAFMGFDSLETVELTENLRSIGNYAFDNCHNLANLEFPDSLSSVGSAAFNACAFESIVLGSGMTSINYGTFSNCKKLTSVVIPENIKFIDRYAFAYCSSLKSIVIPDTVISMGRAVFAGCSSLESITIPFVGESIKTYGDTYQYPLGYIFGTDSYEGCSYVTQSYYGSSTSSTTTETYCIPGSLKQVTVTGGIILRGSFSNCTTIKSLVLGKNVEYISNSSFENCLRLEEVYFEGSVDEWSLFGIGDGNDPVKNATIYYYSENEPTADGNFWHYDENGNVAVW